MSQKIREKFAKNLQKICEIFVKYSRKIREKLTFVNFSGFFHEFFANILQILIFREYFANISRIFHEYFANFLRQTTQWGRNGFNLGEWTIFFWKFYTFFLKEPSQIFLYL